MLTLVGRLVATCAITLALAVAAFAQDAVVVTEPGTSEVVIPYGQWVSTVAASLRDVIVASAVAALAWLSRSLPYHVAWLLKTKAAEQWLAAAIDRGLNAVAGATKGKTLTVAVGHEVIAEATQYMIDNAPRWLVTWLDGESGIRERIITRLDMAPSAAEPIVSREPQGGRS